MLLVTQSALLPPEGAAGTGEIEYVSPRPGARWVQKETNIVARWRGVERLDRAGVARMFDVVGSKTGRHQGTTAVSDDDRTALFQPDIPFLPGEEVTVSLTGPAGLEFSLTFRISDRDVSPVSPSGAECCEQPGLMKPGATDTIRRFFNSTSTAFDVALPSDFPFLDIPVSDSPADGRIFLARWATNPYLLILENDGAPVFYRRVPVDPRDFKVQLTGMLTYYLGGNLNAFYSMDSTYSVVDSFRCGNGYETDNHELLLLENGHALIIGRDYRQVDMRQYVAEGDSNATVIGNIVQELDREHRVVFEWRSWDHFEITDVTDFPLTASEVDYVHMNSIEVDTDGNLVLSSRNMSEVTKISRMTGEIIWRLGGKNNDFAIMNDPENGISYQHDARSHGNGRYTIFDNGNYHSTPVSRAIEYDIDTVAMTATLVWEYRHDPLRHTPWMGNAQRLPNGNTLIGWADASLPKITEVRPDGTKAYELDFVDQAVCYRAFRFPWRGRAAVPYLIAESYRDTVTLLMNTFEDSSVVRYRIYGGPMPNPTSLLDSAASSVYQIVGLQEGTTYYFRVTAVDSNGEEGGSSNEVSILVRSLQPGQNMVLNGDFSYGTQSWVLNQYEGALAVGFVTSDSVYQVQISFPGSQTWSIQLAQVGIELVQWKNYIFEFDAYGADRRFLEAKVESNSLSPVNYGRSGTLFLTGTKRHFSYSFTMRRPTDRQARVVFNCGKSRPDVFVDNVSVREELPSDVVGETDGPPGSFALLDAYPNPFNPSTTIRYELPEQAHVVLKVFSVVGAEVATLADEVQEAGRRSVVFEAGGLASGVYLYRLSVGGFVQTRKMLLLQ